MPSEMSQVDSLVKWVNSMNWENVPFVHSIGWKLPIYAVLSYVVFVVFYIPYYMKNRKPIAFLDRAVQYWNLFLFLFNSTWALWITALLVQLFINDGIHGVVCDPQSRFWKGQNMFVIWGFLMSKFFELGDTVFLAFRKKPIIFLHWYHHVTVLLYCWLAVESQHSCCVVFGFMNSWIHMFMYYYYWRAASGVKMWWGRWLTLAQTSQMFLGILLTLNWAFYKNQNPSTCLSKDPFATIWSASLMYGSYFVLFIKFYHMKSNKAEKGE